MGLEVGNRVLESIGRRESLRSLLAFSDLHEQIRSRHANAESDSPAAADHTLFQTERFVLDEVLQLICERTQTLTQADAVLVALAAGREMICRAAAGPLPIPQGIRLDTGSPLLRDCLKSGKILRCDDSETQAHVSFDVSRLIGARSTVLVPLRGRHANLGVLQAFSLTPWFFTDQDVRCLDLFAELILAALKPEDQNRRFHWLADVADEVLLGRPAHRVLSDGWVHQALALAPVASVVASGTEQTASNLTQATPLEPGQLELPEMEPAVVQSAAIEFPAIKASLPTETAPASPRETPEQPFVIPVTAVELADLESPEHAAEGENDEEPSSLAEPVPCSDPAPTPSFLHDTSLPLASHPGLSVVMGLVAVAALFSAGVWWGMQVHSKAKAAPTRNASAPGFVTSPAPPLPDDLSPAVSDNLMAPAQAPSGDPPLTAVPEDKLTTLPKITGVRHWSSSIGSTVVIDMEDQVPYEVHRLMSPERIYFDLHDTALPPDLDGKTMDVGDASLTRVRVAQPVAGISRVVLDTKEGSNFSVSMESNPYRLVVELREPTKLAAPNRPVPVSPGEKAAPTASLAANLSSQPLPAPALPAQIVPAKVGKFRIVLDPGHGGWDLGTVGQQGLLEKDLVLDVTRRLGKLLRARLGADVVFTRTGDDYLPLDQRADFANQAQADLFVSVHANYSKLATARGVETYYSNKFLAPGSLEFGSQEISSQEISSQGIGSRESGKTGDAASARVTPASLSAGGLREKADESRRLAASVQRALFAALAVKSPDIRDRGIKDASFAVLTGTTMPAILTEISFVSSPTDEHNLQNEAYRQQIAEALYKGIASYKESSPRAKVAQLRPAAGGR